MGELTVHLVRHGQSYNTHRPAGEPYPANPPLTPAGVAQAERLAQRFRAIPVERLVSSPMRRAVETARIVGEALAVPVEVWTGCYEFRAEPGYWSWGARDLRDAYPDVVLPADLAADPWYYGEEPVDRAIARVDAFLRWLRDQSRDSSNGHLVVVTHGGFTGLVLGRALWLDPSALDGSFLFHNTAVTTLRLTERSTRIVTINDTSHLAGSTELDPLRGVSR